MAIDSVKESLKRITGESAAAEQDDSQNTVWWALRWLGIYRITLSVIFICSWLFFQGKTILGSTNPTLFLFISVLYFLIALTTLYTSHYKKLSVSAQVDAFIFIDIFAISFCLHASGGIVSGMSTLLMVAVASGAILAAGRTAFAFAAVAAFIVLGEQTYQVLNQNASPDNYLQAGLLGISLFVTAFVANAIARQLKRSDVLAQQRGVDLQNMSQLNEYIIQRMESGVMVVDQKNRIRLINQAACYLLGLPKQMEMQPLEEISRDLVTQLNNWRANPAKDSKIFRVTGSVEIFPRFTQIAMRDYDGVLIILEDTSMLDQQAQTLKMTAMGRLTASIAHEIRNPLGAISHAGQLLAESPNLDQADKRLTKIIREQSVRMNTIIENVMQLSRRDQAVLEHIKLKDWLTGFIDEFVKSQGLNISDIALHVYPDNATVYMDASHLHQIMFNLCQNAIRYGQSGKGKKMLELHAGISTDTKGAFLDVIDNGPGIDPEMSRQIFEPFFTTASKGTGLGLYIARELAEANQAHLDYIPVPAGGSCFRISFAKDKRR